MAKNDFAAVAALLAPKGRVRAMGPFRALRSALPGASDRVIQGLISPWEDAGMPGVVGRRGFCFDVDRRELARWALTHLETERSWSYDQLRKALTGGQKAPSKASSAPVRVAAPAMPVRRANGVPAAKPAPSKKEVARRARADRRARNAEQNAARRERQRKLALESTVETATPAPAVEVVTVRAETPEPIAPLPEAEGPRTYARLAAQTYREFARPGRKVDERAWDKAFDAVVEAAQEAGETRGLATTIASRATATLREYLLESAAAQKAA